MLDFKGFLATHSPVIIHASTNEGVQRMAEEPKKRRMGLVFLLVFAGVIGGCVEAFNEGLRTALDVPLLGLLFMLFRADIHIDHLEKDIAALKALLAEGNAPSRSK